MKKHLLRAAMLLLPVVALGNGEPVLPQAGGFVALQALEPGGNFSVGMLDGVLPGANLEDDWLFDAEAGDEMRVRLEDQDPARRLTVQLRNTAGAVLTAQTGQAGQPTELAAYTIAVPGTYTVRVFSPDGATAYRGRILLNRGEVSLELEPNNGEATATPMGRIATGVNAYTLRGGGALDTTDMWGDYFEVGYLSGDETLQISREMPLLGSVTSEMVLSQATAGGRLQTFGRGESGSFAVPEPGRVYIQIREQGDTPYALDFDGEDDMVVIPHDPSLQVQAFTVEFWVMPRSLKAGLQPLVTKQADDGSERNFGVYIFGNSMRIQQSFQLNGSTTVRTRTSGTSQVLILNQWNHVAVTYNGSAFATYINGASAGATTTSGTPFVAGHPIKIGGEVAGSYENFDGRIGDVRLWNVARSAEEIALDWKQTVAADAAGLAGNWSMLEGVGGSISDRTANANVGTLGNGDPAEVPLWVASGPPVGTSGSLTSAYLLKVDVTDSTRPEVTGTTLPEDLSIMETIIRDWQVAFTEELHPDSVNSGMPFSMTWAGEDGVLGTSDDLEYPLSIDPYSGGNSVTVRVADASLQAGLHQFVVTTGVTDRAGNPLETDYVQTFTLEPLGLYVVELPGNDVSERATPIGRGAMGASGRLLVEDPVGSGLWHGYARGNVRDRDTFDWYEFEAEAGQVLILTGESQGTSGAGLRYQVYRPDGSSLLSIFGGSNGIAQGTRTMLPETGTYSLRVWYYYDFYDEYRIHVLLGDPPIQPETESNNNFNASKPVVLNPDGAGNKVASVAGKLERGDSTDFHDLGLLASGTQITVNLTIPATAGDFEPTLALFRTGNVLVLEEAVGALALSHTVSDGGNYSLRVTGLPQALASTYLADITLTDLNAPQIVAETLPAEASATDTIFHRFSLTFDKDMAAATVNDPASYALRGAGPDGSFGTADDTLHGIALWSTYTQGSTASLFLEDGPLQPGLYRFSATTSLLDTFGNPLAAPFVREFEVVGMDGFVLDRGGNTSFSTAVPLAPGSGAFGGSFVPDGILEIATATTPERVRIGDFDGDGHPDLAVLRRSGAQLQLFFGDGAGNFSDPVNVATGSNPWDIETADLDDDDQDEIVISNRNSANLQIVSVMAERTTETLVLDLPPGTAPCEMAIVDLSGDGVLDLAVALRDSNQVGVFTGTGAGGFSTAHIADLPPEASQPEALTVGDFDNDGRIDIALGNAGSGNVVILWNQADAFAVEGVASFSQSSLIASLSNIVSLQAVDLEADGSVDLVAVRSGSNAEFAILRNEGGRVFGESETGTFREGNSTSYEIRPLPSGLLSAQGVLVARESGIYLLSGPSLDEQLYYAQSSTRSAAIADLDGDSLPDVAVVRRNFNRVTVYFGAEGLEIPVSFAALGMRTVFGRGNLSTSTDTDFFAFYANAGDRLELVGQPRDPASTSGLEYRIYTPRGSSLTVANGSSNGDAQTAPRILTESGIYYLRVSNYYNYYEEYQFRISLIPGPWAQERENNNSVAQSSSNAMEFFPTVGGQTARSFGTLQRNDAFDYFSIGNLAPGVDIEVTVYFPDYNPTPLTAQVHLDGEGLLQSDVIAQSGDTINYEVLGTGRHVIALTGSPRDFRSFYAVEVTVIDSVPPQIVDTTLPDEGTTVTEVWDRFTLSFSEDMLAETVNDPAHYELIEAGADGNFGTADDVAYTVALNAAYTNGLLVNYLVADGPLQPGTYRFTATTGLADLNLNNMASPFERTFSVENIPGYILEQRFSNSVADATRLSTGLPGGFDGSFAADGTTALAGLGNGVARIRAADFNQDGHVDLLILRRAAGEVRLLQGDGSGSFTETANLPHTGEFWDLQVLDVDGDDYPDFVASNRSANVVSVFVNDQAGGFDQLDFPVSSDPREIVVHDLSGNGLPDVAVALRGSNAVFLLFNDAVDGLQPETLTEVVAPGSLPEGIGAGDFNGDGFADLALALNGASDVAILYGTAGGNFAPATLFPIEFDNGTTLAVADLDGDGRDDLVVSGAWPGQAIRLFADPVDGFGEPQPLNLNNATTYELGLPDLDGDGIPDLVMARSNGVFVLYGFGDGAFGDSTLYTGNTYSVAIADVDGDARPDLLAAVFNSSDLTLRRGNGFIDLEADDIGSGVRHVFARGRRTTTSEVDYFVFSGRAGEVVTIGSDSLGVWASGLSYTLRLPGSAGTSLRTLNASLYGYGTMTPVVLPVDGTYSISITSNYQYLGEYRFRLSIAPVGWDVESESNDSTGASDQLALTLQPDGSRQSEVLGYLYSGETQDFFNVGNLAPGTQLQVSVTQPGFSDLMPQLRILSGSNSNLVESTTGQAISYLVPEDAGGLHYVRVAGSPTSINSVYYLTVTLVDSQPPTVIGDNLPAEFTTVNGLIDTFRLDFSEDMQAASVNNIANYDLRSAGDDGVFGSFDDHVIPLSLAGNYTSGLLANYRIDSGPLAPGIYQLTVAPSLRDLAGNQMGQPYVRTFVVAPLEDFTNEVEPNNTRQTATPVVMNPGLLDAKTGGGRGRLQTSNESDFWSFEAQEGDRVLLSVQTPGSPSFSGLNYRILDPSGSIISNVTAPSNGAADFAPVTIAEDGTYSLQVRLNWSYTGEYQFRLLLVPEGLVVELEPNDTVETATPVALASIDEVDTIGATAAGLLRQAGDLDYFAIGEVLAGSSVFLSARTADGSPLIPVVALYNALNQYRQEVAGGSASDGVAEVAITQSGEYYALVRAFGSTHGISSSYVLDVQVAPTGGLTFPNLVPSQLATDAGPLLSGDSLNVSFRVDNVGSEATPVAQWLDRVVLSPSGSPSDPGNIVLANLAHEGVLANGSHYTVNDNVALPDGIQGSYFVGVFTDASQLVNEFLFEGDNILFSESPITVNLRDYPDLVVEDFDIEELAASQFRISWVTANRGLGATPGAFSERLRIRVLPSLAIVHEEIFEEPVGFAPDGERIRSLDYTAPGGGSYRVEVRTDFLSEIFEFGSNGAFAAEQNNLVNGSFAVIRNFTIALSANPEGAGTATGGGVFPEGQPITVSAVADTSALPYSFAYWAENGVPRSTAAEYTFTPNSDRNLVAVFSLPQFFIGASAEPEGAGSVGGTGFYTFGQAASLSANPSAGYLFEHWKEGATILGSQNPITFSVNAARSLTAVFAEANPEHTVTVATQPDTVASLPGAAVYQNGEVLAVTAPESVESGDSEFLFHRWLLNGVFLSNARAVNYTFTTQDPAEMAFVAVYNERSLRPRVSQVAANKSGTVPAAFDYVLTLTFDRPMDTAVVPSFELLSVDAPTVPGFSGAGSWLSNTQFRLPPVSFGDGQGGTYVLVVSDATDDQGRLMDSDQPFSFNVDVTPPLHPVPVIAETTATTARFSWSGYGAPADLSFFRVYRATEAFDDLTALEPLTNLSSGARQYTATGLQLDTTYYLFVAAVDQAGNMQTAVSAIPFTIDSELPPATLPDLILTGTDSVELDWTHYLDGGAPLGLEGFRIYQAAAPFTSVEGLTALTTLDAATTNYAVSGLDRQSPAYFAVVPFNRLGEFTPEIATREWTDPLSGTLTSEFVFDEGDALIQDILIIGTGGRLELQPGSTLQFGPGAGIEVHGGVLIAEGTQLDPIHFTSASEAAGTAARGDWAGIHFVESATGSRLSDVWIRYGAGLQVSSGTPDLARVALVWNTPAAIALNGTASIDLAGGYIGFNDVGISLADAANAAVSGGVFRNQSGLNAANTGTGDLILDGNWWGTTDEGAIGSTTTGAVSTLNPLVAEPVLSAAAATLDGSTQTGSNPLPLRLLSLNAESFRISEDSTFAGVSFIDVPRGLTDQPFYTTHAFEVAHPLSPSAGIKQLFVQYRGFSGELSTPVVLNIEYITDGPVITAFNLEEGDELNRPFVVEASAQATLGLRALRFMVDGMEVFSVAGSPLNARWDIRALAPGTKRVMIEAEDSSGNVATRAVNVFVAPQAPGSPQILTPLDGASTNQAATNVAGIAEPGIAVRLTRSGAVVGTTTAAMGNGSFSFADVGLFEGSNTFVATAFDSLGESSSAPVNLVLNTRPPSALTLLPPEASPESATHFFWEFTSAVDRPTRFRLFVHTEDFANPASAFYASSLLTEMNLALPASIGDGTYFAAVVGYDAAGNASAVSERVTFSLDRTAPAISLAFDRSSPIGPGPLQITLTANEPLQGIPVLTVRSAGASQTVGIPLVQETAQRFVGTLPVSELSVRSGTAQFAVVARDLTGNRFSGAPTAPVVIFDVTRPTGTISVDPVSPVSIAEPVTLEVTLSLSKPPAPGTVPNLQFIPPAGATFPFTTAGGFAAITPDQLVWRGDLPLGPDNGNGFGNFTLSVTDSVGNTGTSIVSGRELELYNTALPTPPGRPTGLVATSLPGGEIRITWQAVENAETYSIYRAEGTPSSPPTELLIAGLNQLTYTDLPAADGIYSYVITATRRGSEGLPSGILPAVSDREPPAAPENVTAELTNAGVVINWSAPTTGNPPTRYRVYRNDSLIRTETLPRTITDSPPRGIMTYRVASVDFYGNEASSDEFTFELLVGAVGNFAVRVVQGNAPLLTWTRPDSQAVGAHVYRNGVRQTAFPTAAFLYVDTLGIGLDSVEYTVRAVNASGNESAPKSLVVHPVGMNLVVNPDPSGNAQAPVVEYFDLLSVSLQNRARAETQPLAISSIEVERTRPGGDIAYAEHEVDWDIASGTNANAQLVVASAITPGVIDTATVQFIERNEVSGSTLTYQFTRTMPGALRADPSIAIALDSQPLAGGLSDFTLTVSNRGLTPIEFVAAREVGQEPGDLYLSIQTAEGTEVQRTAYHGIPEGAILRPNGDVVVKLEPGQSKSLVMTDVLVPELLGESGNAVFEAILLPIYYRYAQADEAVSGPLRGSRSSNLTQSPYFGTAATAETRYSNNAEIEITGQAIDRETMQPVADAPLKIGYSSRGYTWFEETQTDENGDYSHLFVPPAGFSGRVRIWAAHPDVFDVLDQVEIEFFRMFLSPNLGDIVMSRADTIDFSLQLINPGELTLSGFNLQIEAFIQDGEDSIPVTGMSVAFINGPPNPLGPRERRRVAFRMTADADVPDDPIVTIRLNTDQGATAVFTGRVSLRPAQAILAVVAPQLGYVDVSVDRGGLISREVTLTNRGLRPLTNVKLHPPLNVPWFRFNLETGSDGLISLPDIPVGGNFTFSTIFAPPEDVELGTYNDSLRITGENAVADFTFFLNARVTSNLTGDVAFVVRNMFGDPVPNARVRLRNAALRTEVGPLNTDALGGVTFENLQEGPWSYQISAPSHSTESGVFEILPDQTTMVEEMLTRSLVTVNFTVVPKPFTDRYEIIIEQTFTTRVPFPVMVVTPPSVEFQNPQPGFETIIMAQIRNEGLIRMFDVEIEGSDTAFATLTPLITYLPEILPMETIEVPFRVRVSGSGGAGGGAGGAAMAAASGGIADPSSYGENLSTCLSTFLLPGTLDPNVMRGLAALANAGAASFSGATIAIAGSMLVLFDLYSAVSTLVNPTQVLGTIIGCIVGSFFADSGGGSGARGGGGGGGGNGYGFTGFGCFTGDTPVLLADGSTIPIEEIRAGMPVRTDAFGRARPVAQKIIRESGNLYHLTVSGARDGQPEQLIRVTGEHPVWTDERGWLAVAQLQPGQWLHHADGSLREVLELERQPGTHRVYTLEVESDNAFYAEGILFQDLCNGQWLPALTTSSPAN